MSTVRDAIVAQIERLAARGLRPRLRPPTPFRAADVSPRESSVKAAQDEARRAERAARLVPLGEIFWAGVEKTETCWVWAGELHESGYGRVRWMGKRMQAHRVAWALSHGGELPADKRIGQICGNRACVQPDHLFDGR